MPTNIKRQYFSVVLLEVQSGSVLFATPTHSVIGWTNTDVGLKIYYDHNDMLLLRCCTTDGSDRELNALLRRLEAVTNGEEAKEILLRRPKPTDSLGFHIQEEGIVVDVDMFGVVWKAGLRQGSRIVEVGFLKMEQSKLFFLDRRMCCGYNDSRANGFSVGTYTGPYFSDSSDG